MQIQEAGRAQDPYNLLLKGEVVDQKETWSPCHHIAGQLRMEPVHVTLDLR